MKNAIPMKFGMLTNLMIQISKMQSNFINFQNTCLFKALLVQILENASIKMKYDLSANLITIGTYFGEFGPKIERCFFSNEIWHNDWMN